MLLDPMHTKVGFDYTGASSRKTKPFQSVQVIWWPTNAVLNENTTTYNMALRVFPYLDFAMSRYYVDFFVKNDTSGTFKNLLSRIYHTSIVRDQITQPDLASYLSRIPRPGFGLIELDAWLQNPPVWDSP